MNTVSIRAAGQRLKSCFVDREFIMRSQGQVRFLRVSARAQMRAAAGVGAFAALWLGSMAGITVWHYASSTDRAANMRVRSLQCHCLASDWVAGRCLPER